MWAKKLTLFTILVVAYSLYSDLAYAGAPSISDSARNWLQYGVLGLACLGAAYHAHRKFRRSAIALLGKPMLPIYMTRRPLYFAGLISYALFAIVAFVLIVFLYPSIHPFTEEILPASLYQKISKIMGGEHVTITSFVIFACVIFFFLLQIEKSWNPLHYMWRISAASVGIPRKARHIATSIQTRLDVPESWVGQLSTSENFPADCFMLSRSTLERKWAEIVYMRAWLVNQRDNKGGVFFNEKSIGFPELAYSPSNRFSRTRDSYRVTMEDPQRSLSDLSEDIEKLHTDFARLVACYLIYDNSKEQSLWAGLEEFGVSRTRHIRTRPIAILYYIIAITIAVFLGLILSSVTYDLVTQGTVDTSKLSLTLKTWWSYSVGMYCLPIFTVILVRYVCERLDTWENTLHTDFYIVSFLLGVLISGLVIAVGLKVSPPPGREALTNMSILGLFWSRILWSIAPGVMTAFVAYRMDVGHPHNPDGRLSVRRTIGWTVLMALVFTSIVGLVCVAEWTNIAAFSPAPSKFVFTASATAFTIGIALSAVSGAGFSIIRPSRHPSGNDDAVGIPGMPQAAN